MEWYHTILATACGFGFIFLLGWIMKLQGQVKDRPTFQWCEEHFTSKDVITVKLDKIEEDIADIKDNIKKIANGKKNEPS
jgi:hypothetical protein